MRFDTPIYFQRVTEGEYNERTGDYNAPAIVEVQRYASVTNSGTDVLQLVYGELRQGSLTVRLQNYFAEPYDRIRIGEKVYKVDMSRRLPRMQALVISEVQ